MDEPFTVLSVQPALELVTGTRYWYFTYCNYRNRERQTVVAAKDELEAYTKATARLKHFKNSADRLICQNQRART